MTEFKLPDDCPAHLAIVGEIGHFAVAVEKLDKKFDKGLYLLLANLVGLLVIIVSRIFTG